MGAEGAAAPGGEADSEGGGDDGVDPAGGGDAALTPDARRELARVQAHAGVLLDIVVRIVDRREGRHRAVSLLSAWEGFGRFSRECCGVEPATLLRAWRLLAGEPAAEVRGMYPNARAGEAQAANWHASLAGAWGRHAAED